MLYSFFNFGSSRLSTVLVKTLNLGINGATFSCAVTLAIQFIMYSIVTKIIMHKEEKNIELK